MVHLMLSIGTLGQAYTVMVFMMGMLLSYTLRMT